MSKDKGNVPDIARDYEGVSAYAHLIPAQQITPEQQANRDDLAARAREFYGENDMQLGNAYSPAAKATETSAEPYYTLEKDYLGITPEGGGATCDKAMALKQRNLPVHQMRGFD